ncbi:hypothetical protein E4T42_06801 [Aureobasidium subglaciale]|nr:hypothetical protein E4T42_06801 [Aureobasidium subglaciale]
MPHTVMLPAPVDTPHISGSPERRLLPRIRQKRAQVARACDECRAHRTKCDNNRPCSNCNDKGRRCSNSDTRKVLTLSQAYRKIEDLRQKVQDLESRLERDPENRVTTQYTPDLLSRSERSDSQSENHTSEQGASKIKPWAGIKLRPVRSPHETWFGPSSLYHFMKRLSTFLTSSLQESYTADSMLLNSESSRNFSGAPDFLEGPSTYVTSTPWLPLPEGLAKDLTPMQEEYFTSLFWQSFHTASLAIIDEAEFKEHHQSLWIGSGNVRKSSALVDIVLAMCMQYGISTLPTNQQGKIADNHDATIAGRWHYRRCQSLLTHEMESPTISTLQCHLLCALYLCGGSFHNMVDSCVGLAVRTAYMLGLHLDPPKTMPLREQEKRRRLWWAVYVFDSKINMKLGRPFLLRDSHVMPQIPSDDLETAMISGSSFAPLGDNATWLSFNLQNIKLFMAVRAAHTAFYNADLKLSEGETIWDYPQILEESANLMRPHIKLLDNWTNEVPSGLKTQRQNGSRPLSTDASVLEIEAFAPMWVQRQRLLLELMYHNLSISLYRSFIPLVSNPASGPITGEIAVRCAEHAIAFTNILHQVLSSTSILDGWHEVFHWQWNAAMTLIGFIITYPNSPSTTAARGALDVSIAVFSIYGKSLSIANSAGDIVRNLCAKIGKISLQYAGVQNATFDGSFMGTGPLAPDNQNIDWSFYDMSVPAWENLFDVALDIDFWGDMSTL